MPSDTAGNTLATANVLVSLIIRGDAKNKKRLALGEGFKILSSGTRIIHDTNELSILNKDKDLPLKLWICWLKRDFQRLKFERLSLMRC